MTGTMRMATLWKLGPDGETTVLRDDLPPTLSPEEATRVHRFLTRGFVVATATARLRDELDLTRGDAVPLSFSTDGHWVWTGELAYYLAAHAIPPPALFLEHIRACGYEPAAVDAETRARALAVVRGE